MAAYVAVELLDRRAVAGAERVDQRAGVTLPWRVHGARLSGRTQSSGDGAPPRVSRGSYGTAKHRLDDEPV